MPSGSGEVFFFSGNAIRPLPARSFRAGLFGASLEGVPQRLIEIEPNISLAVVVSIILTSIVFSVIVARHESARNKREKDSEPDSP